MSPVHHSRREWLLNWLVIGSKWFMRQSLHIRLWHRFCWVVVNIWLLQFLKPRNNIFRLLILVPDLSTSSIASSGAGHHLNIRIITFFSFDQWHCFLNISEPITFGHLYLLTIYCADDLHEIIVLYCFLMDVLCSESFHQKINVAVWCLVLKESKLGNEVLLLQE